jgi:hypothetical protein
LHRISRILLTARLVSRDAVGRGHLADHHARRDPLADVFRPEPAAAVPDMAARRNAEIRRIM